MATAIIFFVHHDCFIIYEETVSAVDTFQTTLMIQSFVPTDVDCVIIDDKKELE